MARLFFIITVMALLTSTAVAQQVTVDLKKIDSTLAGQILEAQKKADIAAPTAIADQAKQWADIGTAVGTGIAATAKSLSVEINDFVKTPVGKWAFFFLFWYIIGHKIWTILAGTIIWIVLGRIIWHSFTIFHRPKPIGLDDGHGGKKVDLVTYKFNSNEARATSAFFHVSAFILLSCIMIVVILV